MVALAAGSKAKVDELYKKTIALGAKDEGPAGSRGDGSYFRDLDGNKIVFFAVLPVQLKIAFYCFAAPTFFIAPPIRSPRSKCKSMAKTVALMSLRRSFEHRQAIASRFVEGSLGGRLP